VTYGTKKIEEAFKEAFEPYFRDPEDMWLEHLEQEKNQKQHKFANKETNTKE
jgi:hypothetical protein